MEPPADAAPAAELDPATQPDRSATSWEERGYLAGLAAAIFILGVLALPMFRRQVYALDDLGHAHLPMRMLYAEAMAEGHSVLWTPSLFCGFFLHGEGQVGMFHPLHWLLYRLLPLDVAFNIEVLINYPALIVGTFLLLRCWRIRRDAALAGALAFGLGSFNLWHLVHVNAVANVAHLPWLLLAIDVVLRTPRGPRVVLAAVGLALLTASQVLLGHPQTVYLSALVQVPYTLLLLAQTRRLGRLTLLLPAPLLGLLLGGVQLWPTADAVAHSYRDDASEEFRSIGSLYPAHLVQGIAPYVYRDLAPAEREYRLRAHEYGVYVGAMPLVLLGWLLVRGRQSTGPHSLVAAAVLLAAVGVVFALGKQIAPLHHWMLSLPIVGMFRVAARYLVLTQLGLAVLAAVALADVAQLAARDERVAWLRLWPLAIAPLASLAVAVGIWFVEPADEGPLDWARGSAFAIWSGPVIFGLAASLVAAAARGWPLAVPAAVVLMAIDGAVFGAAFLWQEPPLTITQVAALRTVPPRASEGRCYYFPPTSVPVMRGVHLQNGYVALRPRRLTEEAAAHLEDDQQQSYAELVWRLSGVRYLVLGETLVRVDEPLPRVRVVAEARLEENLALDLLEIEPRRAAVVAAPVALDQTRRGTAEIVTDEPGAIAVETTTDGRQLLVVAESYHEGWQAEIDGQSVDVIRTNGDFLGVPVAGGTHRVELRFRPESFARGRRWTLWGLALTGLFAVACGLIWRR